MSPMATGRFRACIAFFFVATITSGIEDRKNNTLQCYFIFGDSIVDSGNNNHLNMKGKVNYLPYGIDFPSGPTGRYTNGKTIADILGEQLGFKIFIKPYTKAKGKELLRGVNYASGYAGIRNETGQHVGDRVPLSTQLQHFTKTVSKIREQLGNNRRTKEHLGSCLYFIVMGSNDYINNYFMPKLYPTSKLYKPNKYADLLISQYALKIKQLYKYGARKMAVTAIPPIGCTPYASSTFTNGSSICAGQMNDAAELFNDRLRKLVPALKSNLTGSEIAYLNMYSLMMNRITSVQGGVASVLEECCVSMSNGLCKRSVEPCTNRGNVIFWDATHTSEFLNQLLAFSLYIKIQKIL